MPRLTEQSKAQVLSFYMVLLSGSAFFSDWLGRKRVFDYFVINDKGDDSVKNQFSIKIHGAFLRY